MEYISYEVELDDIINLFYYNAKIFSLSSNHSNDVNSKDEIDKANFRKKVYACI